MKYDIVLSGVGGQGVLSVATVIAKAAMKTGYSVRQSEVHGMSQRGGSVSSHMRISSDPIFSDLIALGTADMILSMEPIESLRHTAYLSPEGVLITAEEPFVNIPDYPEINSVYEQIKRFPHHKCIATKSLATEAGSARAVNMVLIGVAALYLPIEQTCLTETITELFERKGATVVEANLRAFALGAEQ